MTVIRDVFVLFTFAEAKVEVIWFDTSVSDQTFVLRLKLETGLSER